MWLDDYAYQNRWRRRPPVEKAIPALLCLGAAVISRSPVVPLLVLVLMSGLVLLGARIPWQAWLRLLALPLAFLSAGTVAMALSFTGADLLIGEVPLLHLPVGLSRAGLSQAGQTLARALGAVSCLGFLALTTPMTELIGLLRKVRVPVLFLELMALAYRHLFLLLEALRQIRIAQAARLGYATHGNAWRALSGLGGSLLVRTMVRSRQLHLALMARGYEDEIRCLEENYPQSPGNLVAGAVVGLVFLWLAIFLPIGRP